LTKRFETVDLRRVKTVSLTARKSLASTGRRAHVPAIAGADSFFASLPGYLKADDLKALIAAIVSARRRNKPVIWMAGGHLIKVGLNPVVIDLIESGIITGLCLNGAGLIHDSELAMIGRTSEDVAAGIGDGSFGMSRETAAFFAEATAYAEGNGVGLGEAAGTLLEKWKAPYRKGSLLAACYRRGIPAMVHIAVDTDIVCQHPVYDPAAAARASHHDFTLLAREISRGENGGVFVNVGSAVILPEVFLKALTVARNVYRRPKRIVTANFDMISQYRPAVNVVSRPTASGGKGYNFVGHHEIMIPLLAWGIRASYRSKSSRATRTTRRRR
jgi:hypothetical protein